MNLRRLNFIFRLFDFLLWPFVWILGELVFPVQETHAWHVSKYNWRKVIYYGNLGDFKYENIRLF
jgi:hypothetical protein